MTNGEIKQWRLAMGYTQQQAAEALGMALNNYQALERGVSWKTNKPLAIDRRTELACAALAAGITGWTPQ